VVGDCANFIDAMMRQLQPAYHYMAASDWVSYQVKNVHWEYFGAKKKPGIGLNSYAYSYTEKNTIYLGEPFFSDKTHDDILTVIHESFHLARVSLTGEHNLTHEELVGLAAKAGYSNSTLDANESWKQLLQNNCEIKKNESDDDDT
jgi:hypothetical protein